MFSAKIPKNNNGKVILLSEQTKQSNMAKQKKKTRRMSIEGMPQEFLNKEREPGNFDTLMDRAILPQPKKKKKSE